MGVQHSDGPIGGPVRHAQEVVDQRVRTRPS
jgi:hypothetical protein